MESILEELQLQVEEMKLTEENETPLYLAIAGLKQVERLYALSLVTISVVNI